jgi:hypothetical protein
MWHRPPALSKCQVRAESGAFSRHRAGRWRGSRAVPGARPPATA